MFDLDVGCESLVVVSIPAATTSPTYGLTEAEEEIARYAAEGLTNAAIARRRKSSPNTVANQLASIYRKLGVYSRAELAARLHQRPR